MLTWKSPEGLNTPKKTEDYLCWHRKGSEAWVYPEVQEVVMRAQYRFTFHSFSSFFLLLLFCSNAWSVRVAKRLQTRVASTLLFFFPVLFSVPSSLFFLLVSEQKIDANPHFRQEAWERVRAQTCQELIKAGWSP